MRVAPLVAAAAFGWVLGVGRNRGARWSWKTVLLSVAAGAAGTGLFWLWQPLSGFLSATRFGAITIPLDLGFAMLPALLAGALAAWPGAASLGHTTRLILAILSGLSGASTYPALALLQVPITMLPAEIYSTAARWTGRSATAHRTPLGGAVFGILLALGSALSARLVVPGLVSSGNTFLELSIMVLAGAGAGWAVVFVLQRARIFGTSLVPSDSEVDPPWAEGMTIPTDRWSHEDQYSGPSFDSAPGTDDRSAADGPRIIRRDD